MSGSEQLLKPVRTRDGDEAQPAAARDQRPGEGTSSTSARNPSAVASKRVPFSDLAPEDQQFLRTIASLIFTRTTKFLTTDLTAYKTTKMRRLEIFKMLEEGQKKHGDAQLANLLNQTSRELTAKGGSLLHKATKHSKNLIAAALIKFGANLQTQNELGKTPWVPETDQDLGQFMDLYSKEKDDSKRQVLVDNLVYMHYNRKNKSETNALVKAAGEGAAADVLFILKDIAQVLRGISCPGAMIDCKAGSPHSPLECALKRDDDSGNEIAALLMRWGADPAQVATLERERAQSIRAVAAAGASEVGSETAGASTTVHSAHQGPAAAVLQFGVKLAIRTKKEELHKQIVLQRKKVPKSQRPSYFISPSQQQEIQRASEELRALVKRSSWSFGCAEQDEGQRLQELIGETRGMYMNHWQLVIDFASSPFSETVLHTAANDAHTMAVLLLLRHGDADPEVANTAGRTAAETSPSSNIRHFLRRYADDADPVKRQRMISIMVMQHFEESQHSGIRHLITTASTGSLDDVVFALQRLRGDLCGLCDLDAVIDTRAGEVRNSLEVALGRNDAQGKQIALKLLEEGADPDKVRTFGRIRAESLQKQIKINRRKKIQTNSRRGAGVGAALHVESAQMTRGPDGQTKTSNHDNVEHATASEWTSPVPVQRGSRSQVDANPFSMDEPAEMVAVAEPAPEIDLELDIEGEDEPAPGLFGIIFGCCRRWCNSSAAVMDPEKDISIGQL